MLYANDSFVKDDFIIFSCTAVLHNNANRIEFSLAPNEGRNNWCHSKLRDFDFKTFRDFFILRDQKTSGAMAPVAPPSSAPLYILECQKTSYNIGIFYIRPLHFYVKALSRFFSGDN